MFHRKACFIMACAVSLVLLMCHPLAWAQDASVGSRVSGGYAYKLDEEGGATIFKGINEAVVTIPEALGGHPVTRIAASAFSDCESLTEVTIPSNVAGIGGMAFAYCTALSDITITESVRSIEASAFLHCQHVTIACAEGSKARVYALQEGNPVRDLPDSAPTTEPTLAPTAEPTSAPTAEPTPAPTAEPSPMPEGVLPVVDGVVQAGEHWIVVNVGTQDQPAYVKLGEVGDVDGYALKPVNLFGDENTPAFFYYPEGDSPLQVVRVMSMSTQLSAQESAAKAVKDNVAYRKNAVVSEVTQVEIAGRTGWAFSCDYEDEPATEATPAGTIRIYVEYFDAPNGRTILIFASTKPGEALSFPSPASIAQLVEPFAQMLVIDEEGPAQPADRADDIKTPTPADDGFTFRNGVTWNSTPDEIMESEKANSPVQNKMPFFYITDAIGVENASVASHKADLMYLFSDGRLGMILYSFDDKDNAYPSGLYKALSSKYGLPASQDPSGLVNTMNALSGDLPEGLGEDDKAAVWLLSDGTRITLCYSKGLVDMIAYENVALLDALLSGPPENAGGNTDGL